MKILGQGHDENQPKSNQGIYRLWSLILPKMEEFLKVVQKFSREQKSVPGSAERTGTKT